MGLGCILRSLRNSYKYSQKYVANCLNISRNAYMAWENGETQLNLKRLEQICELYQISLQELLIYAYKPKNTVKVSGKRVRKKASLFEQLSGNH